MLHMIKDGYVNLHKLKTIVLDEADELLSRGFKDAIYDISDYLPQKRQVCLFSATMPPECVELCKEILRPNRCSIRVEKQDLSRIGDIHQFYIDVGREHDKLQVLLDIYEAVSVSQSIIFTNRKTTCEELYRELEGKDFTCTMIHGDMEQAQRNAAMKEFKSGSSRVLLTTGLIKRGMDFQGVNLVVNYDLPHDVHVYIHAVGRTGRYGRKGVAINFLAGKRDVSMLRAIEEHYNTEINEMPFPEALMKLM